MASEDPRPVVTLSALYGAGGSVVGPQVAERLGVTFLDRQIPTAVAERAGISEDALSPAGRGPGNGVNRLVSALGRASTIHGTPGHDLDLQQSRIRSYVEEFLARAHASGGVVLGHGGMVVLRNSPVALHVYLRGSQEARLRQAMAMEGLDREAATQRQQLEDKDRIDYVQKAYGVDGNDPGLYHLILDSTALDLGTCVELIVAASRARISRAAGPNGK